MYAIISEGKVLGFEAKIPWVKYKEEYQSYSYTDDMDLAVGIAIDGKQYAYNGKVPYAGAPEALVTKIEDEKYLFESITKARQAEQDISGLDDAIIDVAEVTGTSADDISNLEDAIIELAGIIESKVNN